MANMTPETQNPYSFEDEAAEQALKFYSAEEDSFTCFVIQIPPEPSVLHLHQLSHLVTFVFSWKSKPLPSWYIRNDAIAGSKLIPIPFLPTGQAVIKPVHNARPKLYIPCHDPNSSSSIKQQWSAEDYNKRNPGAYPGFVVTPIFPNNYANCSSIETLADLVNKLYKMTSNYPRANVLPVETIRPKLSDGSSNASFAAVAVAENRELRQELKGLKSFMSNLSEDQFDVTKRVDRLIEWKQRLVKSGDRFSSTAQTVDTLAARHDYVCARLNKMTSDLKRLTVLHSNHYVDNNNVSQELESIQRNLSKNQEDIRNLKKNLGFNYFDLRSQIDELKRKVNNNPHPSYD